MDILRQLRNEYRNVMFLSKQRKRLLNKDICLIASNCNGAMILHDLGLQFKSPFVNLWLRPHDFIKLLSSLEEYMKYDLRFTTEEGIDYPIGLLKDVKIYFQHYRTEQDAKTKWNERVKRMNYNNLFVLFTDRDGCTEQDLLEFDKLPYKKKVVFVNRPHPSIKSAVYIRGFEDEECVGPCMAYKSKISYRRYYDDFDYVEWFNSVLQEE